MKSGSAAEVKLALVGLGHVAEHQVEAIEMIDGLRLVAGCDKDPRTAQRLSKGTAFFSNLEEMLSWKQFDIAMISTPNREHFHHG